MTLRNVNSGQAITAAWANELMRLVKASSQLTVAAPLSLERGRHGHHLSLSERPAVRWMPFLNESGMEVPAWGVLRITGVEETQGQGALKADQVSGSIERLYAVNSSVPVADGGRGRCTFDSPMWAAYETGGTVETGQGFGPEAGNWKLVHGMPGFTVIDVDSDNERVLAMQHMVNVLVGTLDAELSAGGSSTMTVHAGPEGDVSAVGSTVTVYPWMLADGEAISPGVEVVVMWIADDWRVVSAACEEGAQTESQSSLMGGPLESDYLMAQTDLQKSLSSTVQETFI